MAVVFFKVARYSFISNNSNSFNALADIFFNLGQTPLCEFDAHAIDVFNMANNRPKRAKNIPKRLINEISTVKPVKKKKPNATDNNLYEVEI